MPQFKFNAPTQRTYSPPSPIGRAKPGEVREFDKAPDHFWSEVDEKADTPADDAPSVAEKTVVAAAQERRTKYQRTPEVPADTEPDVPAATEEESE